MNEFDYIIENLDSINQQLDEKDARIEQYQSILSNISQILIKYENFDTVEDGVSLHNEIEDEIDNWEYI